MGNSWYEQDSIRFHLKIVFIRIPSICHFVIKRLRSDSLVCSKPLTPINNYKNRAMLKKYSLSIGLTFLLTSTSVHARYTQMIVDGNNQVMPIFFHDNTIRLPGNNGFGHQASLSEPIYHYPAPARIPPLTIKPIAVNQKIQGNPLTGPYHISPERHQIMAAAHSSLGTPYIYGGNNPARGLDCSSLMQHIHKQALGVSIPRTAAQQRNRSRGIDYNNLQPGDLLFFKINRRNNHVGIYIGDGKFIHASSSNRRASIASMNLPYWKKRLVKLGSYLSG